MLHVGTALSVISGREACRPSEQIKKAPAGAGASQGGLRLLVNGGKLLAAFSPFYERKCCAASLKW